MISNPGKPDDKQTFSGDFAVNRQPEIVLKADKPQPPISGRWDFYELNGSLGLNLAEGGLDGAAHMHLAYVIRVKDDSPKPQFHSQAASSPMPNAISGGSRSAAASDKNSLGMKFVPVPGTKVLFGIWDTRVADFEQFVEATGYDATGGMVSLGKDGWKPRGATWKDPGFKQGPEHPVVGVSWDDAKAFCKWLTIKERKEGKIGVDQEYRLPTDEEWSTAVGGGKYPWGSQWPPPEGAGNYAGSEAKDADGPDDFSTIEGYRDAYPRTSPVGSFKANENGLFDMGGNVCQWCEDWYVRSMNSGLLEKYPFLKDDGGGQKYRVVRGASWFIGDPDGLLSSGRGRGDPGCRFGRLGFRCVLVEGSAGASKGSPYSSADSPSIVVDATGITVNEIRVTSDTSRGAFNMSEDKIQLALGKPTKTMATKVDGNLVIWRGISYYTRHSLFMLSFEKDEIEGSYDGTLVVSGVPISRGTKISEINASIGKNGFVQKPNPFNAPRYSWELNYDFHTVRLYCDKDGKVVAAWVSRTADLP